METLTQELVATSENTTIPYSVEKKVVISNSMARKYWKPSSIYEGRILTYVASLIKPTDVAFNVYEIPISEILEHSNVSYSGHTYKIIKKAILQLTSRTIALEENRKITVYSIFAKCSYDDKTKKIEICFNALLKDHFLSLSKNFTQYSIQSYMGLSTIPCQKLYTYLKSYVNTHPYIDVEIDVLHKVLDSPKTQVINYAEFKRKVLVDAHSQINDFTELKFDYQDIRKKQKVLAIRFTFNSKIKRAIIDIPSNNTDTPSFSFKPAPLATDESLIQIEKNKISAKASECLRRHGGDNSKCEDIDNEICQRCLSIRKIH